MNVTMLAQRVGTQMQKSTDAGLLFQVRPTHPPAVALALLLSALLAAGALLLAAAQKLGVL